MSRIADSARASSVSRLGRGLWEAEYSRISDEMMFPVAEVLARNAADLTFVNVSDAGMDSSEGGTAKWARVKSCTE